MSELAFPILVVVVLLVALGLLARPLLLLSLPTPMRDNAIARSKRPCRLCTMVKLCTSAIEGCLGLMVLAMGLGFLMTPDVMRNNGAWSELSGMMPQSLWAWVAISIGIGQIMSAILGNHVLRGACVVVNFAWWVTMSFGLYSTWPQSIGVFTYGAITLVAGISLMSYAAERGSIKRTK